MQKTKVKIICPIHGVFEQSPDNHLSGKCCKECVKSHGEEKIELFLKENKIIFEFQKNLKIVKMFCLYLLIFIFHLKIY